MFVDPSGLDFTPVYKSQKDRILSYIYGITGDDRYQYDKESGKIIFNGDYDETYEFKGGTGIGRALIRALNEYDIKVRLHEGDVSVSTGGNLRIAIYEDNADSEYISDEMLCTFSQKRKTC